MKILLILLSLLTPKGGFAQQADSLRMDSIVHRLPDVVVKGERPIARVKGSTITYDLPRLIEKKALDNIYEAVKELPGVTETDGKLRLAGRPAHVVLDGKVTTMTVDELNALLKSLPPSRIERVEVMYVAPARMQLRGAVINIILKHRTADGMPWQGEANLAWNQDHDATFGERVVVQYQRDKLGVDFLYQHSHGDTYSTTGEDSRHALDDGTVHDVETTGRRRSHGYGHSFRLGMDYDIAKDHQLSLVYNGAYDKHAAQQLIAGDVAGASDLRSHSWLHNVRMDYHVPFGLKASAEMTYYQLPRRQELSSVIPTGALRYTVDNLQRVNRWRFSLSQAHELAEGWGINYGMFYLTSVNHSSQDYLSVSTTIGHRPSSTGTRQREENVNVYAGFGKSFGRKFTLEASLAAEYMHSPAWHRWNLFPTFSLTWLPGPGHVFMLSLSGDRSYPDYWEMTNFITYSNGGYNEVTGNPDLKPSNEYQLQLVYLLKNKYQFVAWMSRDDDYFVQTPYQRHDRLAVSYKTLNFNYQDQAGVQATLPFALGQRLSSSLTLTGVWQHERADAFYDIPFNRRMAYGMAQLKNVVTLSTRPDLVLAVDGNIRSKAIQATYDLPGSGSVDLSLRWLFLKKQATLRLFCDDLFRTGVINPRIDFKGQNLRMKFSCYQYLGVSFTYRFGSYQEKKRKEVDTSRFMKN